jgi:hypothetical protein
MARADGRLTAALLLVALAATGAAGGAPCEEGRGQSGLALAAAGGGLAVAAVEPDSPAAAGGLRVGDGVVQVNGAVPRTCGEFARAVREARRERRALLLLVRRGGAEAALAIAAAAWDRPLPVVAAPPAPPSVRALVATPPPPPLPPGTDVSLDAVTAGLAALVPADRPPTRLAVYRDEVWRLRREVETLAARDAVPAGVAAGLRTVCRYHEAALVAWGAAEGQRERERRPRHVPAADAAPAPWFEGSEVAALLDEFAFLRVAVARDPSPALMVGESAGLWRPLQARALLWERGREELARLTTWIAAGR